MEASLETNPAKITLSQHDMSVGQESHNTMIL